MGTTENSVNRAVKSVIKITHLKRQFVHAVVNYTTKQYTDRPSQLKSMYLLVA
jgi:hypothetical protein